MDWYYADGQDRKGPFGQEDFERLVQQGVVTRQTLVWREGMANWEPYSGPTPPPALNNLSTDQSACAGCGRVFPRSEVIPLADGVYCATCKPAAVQKLKEGVVSTTPAEGVRRQYLSHEASVKSVGFLYYVASIMFLVIGMLGVLRLGSSQSAGIGAAISLLFLGIGICQVIVGTGMRRLRKWARIPTGILSGFGLLGFPVGTIINGYILYLVFSRKGRMVFSDEYRAVIEQTPHIKYRTSIVVWILLGLLVLLFGLAIFGILFGRTSVTR